MQSYKRGITIAHYALGRSEAPESWQDEGERAQRVHPCIVSSEIGPWFS